MRGWDKYHLTFTDPAPLAGGAPAIWTTNNAISLARVRLNCANSPTPRDLPHVLIDSPWYPEWTDVGKAQTLRFSDCWSTTGKPVTLRVLPQAVPPADAAAATVDGMDVHFTPSTAGDHWYQVVASDGENTSPPFHLDQTVFDPALGRDDSHALVLYRFDEGSGNRVHDQSKIAPALDLALPTGLNDAQWVPGQGITLHGRNPLTAIGAADKLLAIAKTKACTIEFWISTQTIFTNYALLAREQNANARNIRIDNYRNNFHVNTHAFTESAEEGPFNRLRTSLQHYVFTWNGSMTRCYCNGAFVGEQFIAWLPGDWQGVYPFTLGNNYLGTFYLFAIHDRCLTPAEIKHNYLAGPSAQSEKT